MKLEKENKKNVTEVKMFSCLDYKEARNEKIYELEILRQSLEIKKKQLSSFYEQILRLKADFENYRKRSEKEKLNYLNSGKERILLKQINVYDIIQQALISIKSSSNIKNIIIGLEMIDKEFLRILKEEGVEEVKCEKFDPSFCEALEYAESKEEDGKILKVYQKGYKKDGKLIRVARVRVAKNSIKNEDKVDS
ncbi:MAG: nucleotide exchange factor GrpE [Endomicrobium sp.]|nr:nucleotide exchange factor GrpE [Endomicrobium sp.]